MLERAGVKRLAGQVRQNAPRWLDRIPELPNIALDLVDQARAGKLNVQTHDPQLEAIRLEIRRLRQRIIMTLIGTGLVVTAAVLFAMRTQENTMLGPLPVSVWVFGLLGCAAVVSALFRGDDGD